MTDRPMRLDHFMPQFHVKSAHEAWIEADLSTTYKALCAVSFSDSFMVRMLLRIRNLGKALPARTHEASLLGNLKSAGFLELAVEPEREIVFGIAGRFWRAKAERVILGSVEEFEQFHTPGYAKAAWNLSLDTVTPMRTRLRTQTRILCFGSAARLKFRLYWTLVGPFSGLTRLVLLKQVKRAAEAKRSQAAQA